MIDINQVWQEVKSNVSGEITAVAYCLWIENLAPVCVRENALVLAAPSKNAMNTVKRNYMEALRKALDKTQSNFSDLIIITEDDRVLFQDAENDAFHDNQIIINSAEEKRSVSPFIARYTFDNFVVGESNKLAYHAAQSVAQNPGSSDGFLNFNPLFIYGSSGLGKTHLLHSIGNFLYENLPSKKVLYVATETLINDFVAAISNNSYNTFRNRYRNIDVLMLDDVQSLENKTGLQDVVFNTFNELYQNGKQIILTSDRPPKEIKTLEDRLVSRFEGGLLADIGKPGLEMRMAIVKKKMILEKIAINDDIILYLAEQCDSNIRELEGNLSKVILYATLMNKTNPDINTAKEALRNSSPKRTGLDGTSIINAVSAYFRISSSDIIGKKKTKDIVEARMVAIYLVNELLSLPLVTIGQLFGSRDHTTIIHSRNKIASSIHENQDVYRAIKDIKSILNV